MGGLFCSEKSKVTEILQFKTQCVIESIAFAKLLLVNKHESLGME